MAPALDTHLVLMRAGQVYQAGWLSEALTTLHLTTAYGVPVRVKQVGGYRVVLWTQSPAN